MKKALIAGFFDVIEDPVRRDFGGAIDRGDIVIVRGRTDPRRGLNIELVKQAVGQLLTGGCTEVLVVLGESASWVQDAVLAILTPYSDRCQIELEVLKDLQDAPGIIRRLSEFGLTAQSPDADSALLMKQIEGQRVFCVRAEKQPSFERTLVRLGFVFSPVQFVEEAVEPSRNSNLIQALGNKAEHFDWLLYAWSGLRTLPADVKRKFGSRGLEADSPMKVCSMFKRRLLKGR